MTTQKQCFKFLLNLLKLVHSKNTRTQHTHNFIAMDDVVSVSARLIKIFTTTNYSLVKYFTKFFGHHFSLLHFSFLFSFKEVLSPHRPPAPPTEYFQFKIGGYDPANLLRTNTDAPELEGYIGCVRGLKIGTNLIDLADINERNLATSKFRLMPVPVPIPAQVQPAIPNTPMIVSPIDYATR